MNIENLFRGSKQEHGGTEPEFGDKGDIPILNSFSEVSLDLVMPPLPVIRILRMYFTSLWANQRPVKIEKCDFRQSRRILVDTMKTRSIDRS